MKKEVPQFDFYTMLSVNLTKLVFKINVNFVRLSNVILTFGVFRIQKLNKITLIMIIVILSALIESRFLVKSDLYQHVGEHMKEFS